MEEKMVEEKKEGGTTFEERVKQVEEASGEPAVKDGVNDDTVFSPKPVEVTLGNKIYKLKPLKLRQMRILIRLSKVNMKNFDEEQLELVLDCLSTILDEPDKAFLENELDVPTLERVFGEITKINYYGVPQPKKADKGTSGN